MTGFEQRLIAAGRSDDIQALVDLIPYHRFLGIRVREEAGDLIATMPHSPMLIGNPILPAIHGGAVGAFLETTAILHLLWARQTRHVPKTITVTIDYLRSAGPADTHARGVITKLGSRVANVRAEAWQGDPAKPVAAANVNFLIKPVER